MSKKSIDSIVKSLLFRVLIVSAAVLPVIPFSGLPVLSGGSDISAAAAESSSGLIAKCSLSCSSDSGVITVTAKTQALRVMSRVGYINMVIQSSTDGESWTDTVRVGDILVSDEKYTILDQYSANVDGGCWYRVVCDHYALGKSYYDGRELEQSVHNESQPVWVAPKQDLPVSTPETTSEVQNTTTAVTAVSAADTAAATTVSGNTPVSGKPQTTAAEQTTSAKITSTAAEATASSEAKTTAAGKSSQKTDSPATGDTLPAVGTLAASVLIAFAVSKRRDKKE
ncbi:MAG: hypothetical protein IJ874_08240 [Ruminococcus sp.]|nr:hypothetical protein [Ruminococcus sp.]